VLTRYALERLLYRLSVSPHRDAFVLKGALLFTLWTGAPHRATRDLDLLGSGEPASARLEQVFRDLCALAVEPDGVAFDARSVRAAHIREDQEYEGVRVLLEARLGAARTGLQVDVGFGDAITPGPVDVAFPTLLDLPAPALRAYPRETVVAEKFQAMVALGIANSRMKDFYDVWALARSFDFDGPALAAAIEATFARRRTPPPGDPPLALTPVFHDDAAKRTQWTAFLRRTGADVGGASFADVAIALHAFVLPPAAALVAAQPFDHVWSAGGPWRRRA
jgi:hypothetical protein